MDTGEFFRRFADRQEIGRDITDTHLSIFYDDGREERATTVSVGSVLSQADAEMARYWFAKNSQEGTISGDSAATRRQWIRSIGVRSSEKQR